MQFTHIYSYQLKQKLQSNNFINTRSRGVNALSQHFYFDRFVYEEIMVPL